MSLYKLYIKVDDVIAKATEVFCAVIIVMLIAVSFSNTVLRYGFSKPLIWAEEVIRYMCVWLSIIGASLTARVDGHTTLDILQETVKNRKVKLALFLITRTLAILSLVVLFPAGLQMVSKLGKVVSPGTGLPTSVMYMAYPVGSICIILGYIRSVPKYGKKIMKGED